MPSVRDLIAGVLAVDPSAPAVEAKGQWRTWGDIYSRMAALTVLYEQLGLGDGSRVALFMRNRFEPYAALFSIVATDRCLVTVNPFYPEATLVADITALKPPVVVAEAQDWDRPGIREAVANIGAAGILLTGDDKEPARLIAGLESIVGPDLRRTAPDIIIEMLTSGTTGKPKRVPLTRGAFQYSFDSALSYEKGREANDAPRLRAGVGILHAPLSHIGGLWGAINTVASGRANCLIERFNVAEWRDAVVRHRPKVAGAPPAALRMIFDAKVPKEDLASLAGLISGTAPVDPNLVQAFWDTYGIPIMSTYGATEFAGAVAGWSIGDFKAHWERKRGAAGRIQRGVQARIVNADTGEDLPFGQEGVLELKSGQLQDPTNWLRTTDRAVLDDEGFIWIRGRADNAIIRGGFKVHPDDVVKAIEAHPAVREAAVVGIKDLRLGEVPAAAIILKAGAEQPSEAELTAFLKERLLPYQVPTRWKFVDDVPRTTSLKPALPALRELLSEAEAA
ncbi:MAG: long-chain fatty acid--CoA ligase [Caulobacter sp.]|nr:long-chain fatty acid--CoA ligase [Caulobacter sp.]